MWNEARLMENFAVDDYDDLIWWDGREWVTICAMSNVDNAIKRLQELQQKWEDGNVERVEFC